MNKHKIIEKADKIQRKIIEKENEWTKIYNKNSIFGDKLRIIKAELRSLREDLRKLIDYSSIDVRLIGCDCGIRETKVWAYYEF